MRLPCSTVLAVLAFFLAGASADVAWAQATNLPPSLSAASDLGFSALRMLGSLVFVLALFLAGVWCFRNWQRLTAPRGPGARLNILEVKSLGHRQALYVVAYEQQRLLLASAPAGITLVTHLPEAEPGELPQVVPSFTETLRHVLATKR